MERIDLREPLATRPLTQQELLALPTEEGLKQLRKDARSLLRQLKKTHEQKIRWSPWGAHIICKASL